MSANDTVLIWSGTTIGSPLPWPSGFDPATVAGGPTYAPSGGSLAFVTTQGRLLLLDFSSGTLQDLYNSIGDSRPNLVCAQFSWLSDDRVFAVTQWSSDSEIDSWTPTVPPTIPCQRDWRVIDVRVGVVVLEQPLGRGMSDFQFAGALGEQEWVVRRLAEADWQMRLWRYDPQNRVFDCILRECPVGERLQFGPAAPWCMRLSAQINPQAVPVDLVLETPDGGHVVQIRNVPPFQGFGPCMTSDGQFLISSTFDHDTGRCRPVVINTITGLQRTLPDGESWVPVALNEARGVILVILTDGLDDGTYSSNLSELPLNVVIQE